MHFLRFRYLFIVLLLQQYPSIAQFSKGMVSLGIGSQLSFTGSHTTNSKYNYGLFSIEANACKFTSDNAFLGIIGGAKFEVDKYNGTEFIARNLFLGGIIRRYIPFNHNVFGLFVANNTIFGSTLNYFNSYGQRYFKINLRPGIYFFLLPNLLFEFSFAEGYLENRSQGVTNYGLSFLNSNTFCDVNIRFLINSSPPKKVLNNRL